MIATIRLGALSIASLAVLLAVSAHAADPATVTFSLDFPNSDPDHYSIMVRADGHAVYESSGKISSDSDDRQNYQTEFTISDATRSLIFDLTARVNYFSGKVDSGDKKLAFTGAKKLVYSDGQKNSSASYNFSAQPVIQQLTALFQNISSTMEFGRRLVYDHRYQKLALDEELKHMEAQAKSSKISELQAVAPVLQEIVEDTSVLNGVRARAKQLIEMGNNAPR